MLTGKIILITGASGGIGAAAALAFDHYGARVAISSRRKEKLEEIATRMKNPLIIAADLTDPSQCHDMIRKVVEHYGHIDILVNNAASIIVAKSDVVEPHDLQQAFSTNLMAPVILTLDAIRHMRKQGKGQIINIGSPGFMMGIPFYSPYVCSKAAFSAWTRTIQAEWAGTEITVCEYFPGYIKTDSKPESRIGEVDQDFLMAGKKNFITKRFTKPKTPEDVASDLIRLILHPRPLMYSDLSVRIGAFISNIPKFRLTIAKQMATTARKKKNLSIFTDL
ncbi:MAG: SDR family oxidoreductase [Bacteroidales bacterium]|jgi:2-deoxy-D-gluconate 3-dehydrogenase|nr:SDR family oxidoreductase [Bacteroidales bacterium]